VTWNGLGVFLQNMRDSGKGGHFRGLEPADKDPPPAMGSLLRFNSCRLRISNQPQRRAATPAQTLRPTIPNGQALVRKPYAEPIKHEVAKT